MRNVGQPEMQILLDEQKMAIHGVRTAEAQAALEMAIGGKTASMNCIDMLIKLQLRANKGGLILTPPKPRCFKYISMALSVLSIPTPIKRALAMLMGLIYWLG